MRLYAVRGASPRAAATTKSLSMTAPNASEGERKYVTVVHADIKSGLELLTERDPEEALKIYEAILELMTQAVQRYDGKAQAYDTADHVANLRAINVTPHVTQNQAVTRTGKTRNSAIDKRTTRHQGYGMSQSRRAMIKCIFGWGKQHGTMRKTKHRGIGRVAANFLLNLIA